MNSSVPGAQGAVLPPLASADAPALPTVPSSAELEQLVQDLDAIIWEMDVASRTFVFVNQRAEEVLGYPLDRWLSGPGFWPEVIVEDSDLARWLERFEPAAAGGRHVLDYPVRRADGSIAWLRDTIRLVRGPGELAPRLRGFMIDITESRKAADALQASESSYRTIFEASSDAIYVLDVETGAVVDVNQAACDLNGYPREEMLALGIGGLSLSEPPYDWDNAKEIIRRAAGGEPQRLEWYTRHSSGSDVWGEVTLRRVTILGQDRVLASARDITERKRVEEELRRTNEELELRVADRTAELHRRTEELEAVFHALPDMFFRLASDGTVLDHRLVSEDRLALPAERLLGRPLSDLLDEMMPGDVGDRIRGALEEVNRTRELVCVEYHLPFEGKARHYEARLLPLADGSLIAIVRDITDRVAAETELRRREEHFRRLIENAHDFVEIVSVEGRTEYISPAVQRILGYAPEELIGTSGFLLADPRELELGRSNLREAARSPGRTLAGEFRVRHRDGSIRVLETFARTLAPDSADEGIVINARDITERKQFEDALQEREQWYRSLIDKAHDLVQVLDTSGKTLYISPSVQHILGYAPEELIGTSALDLVHPDDLASGQEALGSLASDPTTSVAGEFRLRHRDGTYRVLESFGRFISPDVPERGIVVNARDTTERKQFEDALRDSEARYRSLIENAHDVVTILDLEGRIIYESPQLQKVLGYDPAEMIGRRALDFVHPDDVHLPYAALQNILADPGTTFTSEYRFRHQDGSWRYLETFGRTMVADAPEQGLVFNTRDVTERRLAQQALEEREEHFRRLIETSHDLVQTLDSHGRIVYTGPSVERLLGYTPEEITGNGAPEFIHPEDQPRVQAEIVNALSNPGEIIHLEYRVRHKNGGWRWFEAIGRTLSPDTAEHGMVANARDITERREVEAELKRQRSYFEQLLTSVDAGIAAWDAEGRFEYVSPNSIPDPVLREWVIGKTLQEYCEYRNLTPELTRSRIESVADAIATRSVTEYEETITRPDGSPLHLLRRNRPVLDGRGEVERVIGYSIDITERKRTEEAVRRATREAEQAREAAETANRAKSEFLSRMSHELRTPMNSILGFGQLLERSALPPEHRKGVGHILKAGRHLLQLINEVLEIARIEAGRQSLSLEPVHVGTVLQEAVGLVRPLAHQWRVDLDSGPWPTCGVYVQADRQRLTQVLLNVLGNAIKYNRAGGRVRVTCASEARADGHRLLLRVHDTGRGVPSDQVDQLFTPFARLGAERSDVEGTGLGLALSQRLTEAMGGTLTLESTGGEGSVFRLELRITADPLETLEEGPAPVALDGVAHREATLLYIEDNLANLSLVETILLSRPRWRTMPALQGLIGLELAREHRPDLILLDLHLPDIDGEEVLRRLRAEARTVAIPVVVITADATPTAVERLRAAGADAYLTKPLDIDEFLETVQRYLPDERTSR
jgi:PAS domain S-box-containing protein